MIRKLHPKEIETILELWLKTNGSAHAFIERDYWKKNYDFVKGMILTALIYVYKENDIIQGFIGLLEDYIAGLFVLEQLQSKGIGKKLLDYVKCQKTGLSLHVYQKNEKAVHFYLREGFVVLHEQMDENTGQIELNMNWIK